MAEPTRLFVGATTPSPVPGRPCPSWRKKRASQQTTSSSSGCGARVIRIRTSEPCESCRIEKAPPTPSPTPSIGFEAQTRMCEEQAHLVPAGSGRVQPIASRQIDSLPEPVRHSQASEFARCRMDYFFSVLERSAAELVREQQSADDFLPFADRGLSVERQDDGKSPLML